MKGYIAKHRKIFIFGAILIIIFAIITALSTDRSGTEITLTQFIRRDETNSVREQPITITTTQNPVITQPSEPTPPPTYPDLAISFIEGVGFTPGSKNARVGQKVVITNQTLEPINVVELFPKTSTLASGALIEPSASYTFELVTDGLFTYREINSLKTARFWIGE